MPEFESEWSPSFSSVRNRTKHHLHNLLENRKCPKLLKHSKLSSTDDPIVRKKDDGYSLWTMNENGMMNEDIWDVLLSCYYKSCMDIETLDDLGASALITKMKRRTPFLLQRILDFTIIDEEGDRLTNEEKTIVLSERLALLSDALNVDSFFELSVSPSPFDAKYSFHLSAKGLSLDYRQYEESDAIETYSEFVSNLLSILIAEVLKSHNVTTQSTIKENWKINSRVLNVIQMEMNIKEISLTPEQQREPKLKANLMSWEVSSISSFNRTV